MLDRPVCPSPALDADGQSSMCLTVNSVAGGAMVKVIVPVSGVAYTFSCQVLAVDVPEQVQLAVLCDQSKPRTQWRASNPPPLTPGMRVRLLSGRHALPVGRSGEKGRVAETHSCMRPCCGRAAVRYPAPPRGHQWLRRRPTCHPSQSLH